LAGPSCRDPQEVDEVAIVVPSQDLDDLEAAVRQGQDVLAGDVDGDDVAEVACVAVPDRRDGDVAVAVGGEDGSWGGVHPPSAFSRDGLSL